MEKRDIVYHNYGFRPRSAARAGHQNGRRAKSLENQYAIEMLNITKKFPGIIANDNIT